MGRLPGVVTQPIAQKILSLRREGHGMYGGSQYLWLLTRGFWLTGSWKVWTERRILPIGVQFLFFKDM